MIAKVSKGELSPRNVYRWKLKGVAQYYYADNSTSPLPAGFLSEVRPVRIAVPFDFAATNVDEDPLVASPIVSLKLLEYSTSDFKTFNDCTHLRLRVHKDSYEKVLKLSSNGYHDLIYNYRDEGHPRYSASPDTFGAVNHNPVDNFDLETNFHWPSVDDPEEGVLTRWWFFRYKAELSLPFITLFNRVNALTEIRELDVKVKPYRDEDNTLHHTEKQTHTVPVIPYIDHANSAHRAKIEQHVEWSLADAVPDIEDGFSLPVFMAEIFELKALFRNVVAIVTKFPEHAKKLWKNPAKELGQGYLSAIFGWIPLVQDLETILTRLILLQTDIDKLIEQEGTVLTHRYKKSLHPETFQDATWFQESQPITVDETSAGIPLKCPLSVGVTGTNSTTQTSTEFTSDYTYTETKSVEDLVFHGTLRYRYSLGEEWQAQFKELFLKLDRFGINLSVSDIWEIIPFSFVIDWVYDFGSLLENFDSVNLPVEVEILDYCYSYKYRYSETINYQDIDDYNCRLDVDKITDLVADEDWNGHDRNDPEHRLSAIHEGSLPSRGVNRHENGMSLYKPPAYSNPTQKIEMDCYLRRRKNVSLNLKKLFPDLRLPSGKQFVIGAALLTSRWK